LNGKEDKETMARITIDTNIAIHAFKKNKKALDILNGNRII
jgi:hypothetical protein